MVGAGYLLGLLLVSGLIFWILTKLGSVSIGPPPQEEEGAGDSEPG